MSTILLFSIGCDERNPDGRCIRCGETFGWTYLDNGWLWTQSLGSAAKATYTYNALGQVTELAHRKQDMATTLLADFSSMSQDAVGNRVSLTASVPFTTAYSGTTSYTYDAKNQLTQESSTRASGYTNNAFDAVGNPTTFKGTSQSFNSVNQNTLGSTITFDGNGNPGSWNSNSLSWNYNDKLTAIGSTLTAGYSASGLRAWKQNSSSVRAYFLYDGLIPVCELDGSGNVTAYNTVGANGLLARHVNGTGGGSVFYCFDPQGSVSVRVDTSGSVLSTHCNEAWGTQVSTGSGYSSDPYAGYGGQWGYYRDAETGLHLLGHRYYDPSSGRFLNRDPIGYGGGINLYAYCGNNGVRRADALGYMHSMIDEEAGGGGGGLDSGTAAQAGEAGCPLNGNFGVEGPPPSVIVNIGGEGEINQPGVINYNFPGVEEPGWGSSGTSPVPPGKTWNELKGIFPDQEFITGPMDNMPFPDGSVNIVHVNSCPIGGRNWLGIPYPQEDEIWRILDPNGTLFHDGIPQPRPQ